MACKGCSVDTANGLFGGRDGRVEGAMIRITRLDGSEIMVNAEMIEFIEATPDTIITLASGKKIMVGEAVDLVVKWVIDYRKSCNQPLCSDS